ncbi:SNARE-interacting protein KEULE-like isoform X1 [Salvia splendens]|uniref:SNARE-interacting protein KEULE-like isoform X1 n=2 Tax=Salvia splendens TaxID=180675 RepID=UPI001C274E95|nr:SNARE-interacting protein KEULE-like isoform X1 [Salvia splendens]
MSISDSDTSSQGSEYKNFRQISRDRLLYEMLRSAKTGDSKSSWKVLIMDKITVKIMSYACKMADITEEGVSLVEDIHKRRQPLPSMDAIYFIQPTKENIVIFLSDMSGKSPLYRKAFVFFSSPVSRELVAQIKKDGSVLSRIGALREMNLEYFAIDSQGFITDNERALEDLFGDEENSRRGDACLNVMGSRIATVFASLREFPYVRYRAAKSLDPNTMTTFRDLIPTKLAASVWNNLMKYKANLPNFPQLETCELLILDRSIDQIAPIIHEWTYDAMCHDLLNMDGNKYIHEVPSKTGGRPEKKEVLLEDHDPIWLELRHTHIADASERLHEKMTNFVSKNKAAQIHGSRSGGELSTRDLQKMVQALPQYSEQIEKLSLHVDIAGKINKIIRESGLKDVGQLEQDLVFGDAGTKDIINFLRTKEDVSREYKLRLLMIYAAVYPEKFDDDKISKLMEMAKLPPDDATAVYNMRLLESSSDPKKSSLAPFSLKFDVHKKKHAARKDRAGEEVTWQLSRFYPVIEELVENLSKGKLPRNDFPCMNEPSPTIHGSSHAVTARSGSMPTPHSKRSRRTATWARPRNSDDGYSSDSILRHASSDFKKMGQRIFVFIVGGATRSELRACHKLSAKLQREIVLGSSSLDDPPQFITKLKLVNANELSLDDLQI